MLLRWKFLLPVISFWLTSCTIADQIESTGQGLQFNNSCDAYRPLLEEGVKAARNLAKAGYTASLHASNPAFKAYMGNSNKLSVRRTMRNVYQVLSGRKESIYVECKNEGNCLAPKNVFAWMSRNPNHTFVNICPAIINGGPRTKEAETNYCQLNGSTKSLGHIIMHELLHIPDLTNNVMVYDIAEDTTDCKSIAAGLQKDANGVTIRPTANINNYMYMAEYTLGYTYRQIPSLCNNANDEKTGLRKLQGTNITDLNDGIITPGHNVTEIPIKDIQVVSSAAINFTVADFERAIDSFSNSTDTDLP